MQTNMKYKITLTTFLLFLLAFQTKAQEWLEVGTDNRGQKHYVYTKLVNSQDNDSFSVWTKYTKVEYVTYKGRKTATSKEYKQLYMVKCDENEMASAQLVVYNMRGDVVYSRKDYAEFYPVVPDTIGASIARVACMLKSASERAPEVPGDSTTTETNN